MLFECKVLETTTYYIAETCEVHELECKVTCKESSIHKH
jgi:hypothetical protein